MTKIAPRLALILLLYPWTSLPVADAPAGPRTLDDCERRARDRPGDAQAYDCFTSLARRLRQWDDAAARLEALLDANPAIHAARLQLAWIEHDRGSVRSESLFRDAAEGFADEGDAAGEVYSLVGLAFHLRQQGRTDASSEASSRAAVVAQGSGEPVLLAWVRHQQGSDAYDRGDFETAGRLFREAESSVFPEGPADLQGFVLNGLGNTAAQTGQDDLAMQYYSRWADILDRTGNIFQEAYVRYNVAFIAFRHLEDWPMTSAEVRALVREALDVAVRAGNREVEAASRMQLGRDIEIPLADRIEHLERGLAIQRSLGHARGIISSLRQLAQCRLEADPTRPEEALRLAGEAVARGRDAGSLTDRAGAINTMAELRRKIGPREDGIEASLEALDAVEAIRDLQRDDLVRARYLGQWDFSYYRFSGFLLDPETSARMPESIDLAFRVMERLRARALLDSLDAAGATAIAGGSLLQAERNALLDRIAQVQKRLLDPKAQAQERAGWLGELEALESEERTLRAAIAAASPEFASLRRPEIPSLSDVREALAADEAMLLFQVSTRMITPSTPSDDGGSWLLVVSRRAAEVVRLPERGEIEDAVKFYLGLLERRDGSDSDAAARVYDLILREGLDLLAPEITRLLIVPDRILYRLPFGALRESVDAEPLALTHQIGLVPSATLWMRWRDSSPDLGSRTLLSLADPALPGAEGVEDAERHATLALGLQLGGLPHARSEAQAMNEAFGGRGMLRVGAQASERFLKSAHLADYQVLHIAAHAVIDEEHPERSAVLLAAGAEEEDGLLQIREVVDLDLDGQVVILSSCRSASGELLAGEGVFGLARAFFQAGAHGVIGGLWRLRDDETARFIEDFSRHLGNGSSLGVALAGARRDSIGRGAPAAAWAGLVLLGDQDIVPVPGGSVRPGLPSWLLSMSGAFALAVLILVYLRRARRNPTP